MCPQEEYWSFVLGEGFDIHILRYKFVLFGGFLQVSIINKAEISNTSRSTIVCLCCGM
jgi:hypothetical protein